MFRNYYRCERCGHEWTDEWSAACDDDCPHCGARHLSPYKSDDIGGERQRPAPDKVARIRRLNDRFRSSFMGGHVFLTAGVAALDDKAKAKVLLAVRHFNGFNADNDPYREHDCAIFDVDGERYLFKIDYYDGHYAGYGCYAMQYGSEDPSDPKQTTRVLTIMRADEY